MPTYGKKEYKESNKNKRKARLFNNFINAKNLIILFELSIVIFLLFFGSILGVLIN